jgi:hypothetical protein
LAIATARIEPTGAAELLAQPGRPVSPQGNAAQAFVQKDQGVGALAMGGLHQLQNLELLTVHRQGGGWGMHGRHGVEDYTQGVLLKAFL